MNVFILSTGRCGSMTFARACGHITNYSAAHESRIGELGPQRLAYPANHIESDNRLAWFLGRLERAYPQQVFYVHLRRDPEAVAQSYARRLEPGLIIPAYAHGIHIGLPEDIAPEAETIARDYVDTVNTNIELFLRGRRNSMVFELENAAGDWCRFWSAIGAEGNLAAALAEFEVSYNASEASTGAE